MNEPLTFEEMTLMRKSGKVASKILKSLGFFIRPGRTTKDIEVFFERELEKYPGMEPAFKGFMGYPASLCVSVNEEVIHGIPSGRKISNGDLVSIDLGIKYKGLFVDTARTYLVGKASPLARKLARVTLKSLVAGISRLKPGNHLGDVSSAVQKTVEDNGFSVIRRFVGHGIGRALHVPPEVPNFGEKNSGPKLASGFAIAVEPMVSAGSYEVEILDDGWTARTEDNSLAAHFEHTVAIT
ncbi:MAG: type I methionyl aminopeptidase, partial [Candidatus Omnitrophica bacterium]|nr:type I methionyl aminopeptidase [Candidatus Omnitrophota bacterium]